MPDTDLQLEELRTPPHSIEAEQSVLGGLLLDNAAWDRLGGFLKETDFYRFDHRLIFQHIVQLIAASKPADVITVFESLQTAGKADEVGGLEYLNSLARNTPSAANIRHYAQLVRDRSILRQLITVSDEISASAFQTRGRDVKQILDEAETNIFAIAEESNRETQGFQSINQLLSGVAERIEELYNSDSESDITGIPTGFIDLDRMTSGLQPGDLVIVAGRPSMGKTAFSVNIGEYVAIEQQLPVCIFSMEMSGAQLAGRMLGSVGRLDQHRLRTGRLQDSDWDKLTFAMGKMNDAPLYVDETPALNSMELRARARRLAKQCGQLGLIIIDYLQLMSPSSAGENRATEISEISRGLKALAKELNCPVIALSQLNRSVEQRPNKRPVMSDLRESGAIEQDADLILFIYRDEVYNPDSPDKGIAEIIVGKQRNGPIGSVRLTFLGQYTKFDNYAGSMDYGG
ncbi:MAG: replicative DNA helicase [Oxalobacter sp.]|nr:replicative DNA helicase [Oxalobacter sp.]